MPIDNQTIVYIDRNNRDVTFLFLYIDVKINFQGLKLKCMQVFV